MLVGVLIGGWCVVRSSLCLVVSSVGSRCCLMKFFVFISRICMCFYRIGEGW